MQTELPQEILHFQYMVLKERDRYYILVLNLDVVYLCVVYSGSLHNNVDIKMSTIHKK